MTVGQVTLPWQMNASADTGQMSQDDSFQFQVNAPNPVPQYARLSVMQQQVGGAEAFMEISFNGKSYPGDRQTWDSNKAIPPGGNTGLVPGLNTLTVTARNSGTPGFTAQINTGHKPKGK